MGSKAEVTSDKLLKDLQTVIEDAEALLKATASQAGAMRVTRNRKAGSALTK